MKPHRTELTGRPPKRLLWVGNSYFYYNNSIHHHVAEMARAQDPSTEHQGVSVTISGSGLDWHDIESYFRRDAIGRYAFTSDNDIIFTPQGNGFDAVIMMDSSQGPIHPRLQSSFHGAAKQQSRLVREKGASPVFFMSWAYRNKPEMTARLAHEYTKAGNCNDALVIPAGLAFSRAMAEEPELELYQPDQSHPSLIGTYLAACTAHCTLFRNGWRTNSYVAALPMTVALKLPSVAASTVETYFDRGP